MQQTCQNHHLSFYPKSQMMSFSFIKRVVGCLLIAASLNSCATNPSGGNRKKKLSKSAELTAIENLAFNHEIDHSNFDARVNSRLFSYDLELIANGSERKESGSSFVQTSEKIVRDHTIRYTIRYRKDLPFRIGRAYKFQAAIESETEGATSMSNIFGDRGGSEKNKIFSQGALFNFVIPFEEWVASGEAIGESVISSSLQTFGVVARAGAGTGNTRFGLTIIKVEQLD